MKKNIIISFSICLTTLMSYGQSMKQHQQSFDRFIELKNTNTIMIPVDWEENGKIGDTKIMGHNRTKNIFFYNPVTDIQTSLFDDGKQIILSYSGKTIQYFMSTDTVSQESDDYIFYTVIKEDYNEDQKLSRLDPTYLYSSKIDGTDVQRLTPQGYNLKNYKFLKESNVVLATLYSDEDQNKKFNNQDAEVLYRIDLNDLSKSKIIAKINIKELI